jgi:hypothetical protein
MCPFFFYVTDVEGESSSEEPGFPFDFAQGGESFDLAQDREPVEPPPSRE